MNKFLLIVFVLLRMNSLNAQTLHIYGGSDNGKYLGCLNCDTYESDSIWNEYGKYGSAYSSYSIWNEYGKYGSAYSSYSPWNFYAVNPPIVVDKKGNLYGYLTINTYKLKRAKFELALVLYKYHKLIRTDLSKWYNLLFSVGSKNSKQNLGNHQDSYKIEVSHNDELFIINGEKFEARTYCFNMEEGDDVIFLEGSASGACTSAKLLNLRTSKVCKVWCE